MSSLVRHQLHRMVDSADDTSVLNCLHTRVDLARYLLHSFVDHCTDHGNYDSGFGILFDWSQSLNIPLDSERSMSIIHPTDFSGSAEGTTSRVRAIQQSLEESSSDEEYYGDADGLSLKEQDIGKVGTHEDASGDISKAEWTRRQVSLTELTNEDDDDEEGEDEDDSKEEVSAQDKNEHAEPVVLEVESLSELDTRSTILLESSMKKSQTAKNTEDHVSPMGSVASSEMIVVSGGDHSRRKSSGNSPRSILNSIQRSVVKSPHVSSIRSAITGRRRKSVPLSSFADDVSPVVSATKSSSPVSRYTKMDFDSDMMQDEPAPLVKAVSMDELAARSRKLLKRRRKRGLCGLSTEIWTLIARFCDSMTVIRGLWLVNRELNLLTTHFTCFRTLTLTPNQMAHIPHSIVKRSFKRVKCLEMDWTDSSESVASNRELIAKFLKVLNDVSLLHHYQKPSMMISHDSSLSSTIRSSGTIKKSSSLMKSSEIKTTKKKKKKSLLKSFRLAPGGGPFRLRNSATTVVKFEETSALVELIFAHLTNLCKFKMDKFNIVSLNTFERCLRLYQRQLYFVEVQVLIFDANISERPQLDTAVSLNEPNLLPKTLKHLTLPLLADNSWIITQRLRKLEYLFFFGFERSSSYALQENQCSVEMLHHLAEHCPRLVKCELALGPSDYLPILLRPAIIKLFARCFKLQLFRLATGGNSELCQKTTEEMSTKFGGLKYCSVRSKMEGRVERPVHFIEFRRVKDSSDDTRSRGPSVSGSSRGKLVGIGRRSFSRSDEICEICAREESKSSDIPTVSAVAAFGGSSSSSSRLTLASIAGAAPSSRRRCVHGKLVCSEVDESGRPRKVSESGSSVSISDLDQSCKTLRRD